MKFLVCGLGSIGQRHVRILRRLLGDDIEIGCFRTRKLDIVIDDQQQATFGTAPEIYYRLKTYESLDLALSDLPDAIFITNPISMHVDTALAAARSGCNLFIEKPLNHSMSDVAALADLVEKNRLIAAVGYQLRFHPALKLIKQEIASGAIGRVVSAQIHFGEWLPGMHPYEDYRTSHTSRVDQGGGVLLVLSHEIDYACWLFGRPQRVYCVGGHMSDLEMDGVEDTAHALIEFRLDGRNVPVSVYLDYVQRPPRRWCSVVGESGQIHWDYYENVVRIHTAETGKMKEISFTYFKRNDMFDAQTKNFLAALQGEEELVSGLADGITALRVCLAARQSIVEGRPVDL